jgi:hypothetical protein
VSYALGVRTVRFAWLALGWTLGCAPASGATSARAPSPRVSALPASAAPAIASAAPSAASSKRAEPKISTPVALPPGCTLVPPTLIEPRGFTATLFRGGRVTQTQWVLEPDGTIQSFPSESDDGAPRARKGRTVILKLAQAPAVSSEPARPPPPRIRSVPDGRYHLFGEPRRCTLTLPGEASRIVEMQWYNFASPVDRFAILSPVPRAGWVVILANVSFSPGGTWLAPAMGDVDGDGRNDLAFVAEGVGTCGSVETPDCPLLWVNVFMSATDTSSWPTLVEARTYHRLVVEIGLPPDKVLGDADVEKPRLWRGRIRRGAYEITVSGPKHRHTWTTVLRDGKMTLEGALGGG